MQPRLLPTLTAVALSFACSACPAQEETDLPFRTGTIERYEDGTMRKGRLVDVAEIGGLTCRNWVHYHPDGRLSGVQLATVERIGANEIPADSILWFDGSERLKTAWLSEDLCIQGHPCRGGWGKVATGFHPDGSLESFFPRRSVRVDGIACKASLFAPISLHPNGRLAGCRLEEATVVRGRSFERDAQLRLDPEGNPLFEE